jgi:hypothetical protein
MSLPGQVTFGDMAMGSSAPWSYDLQVPMGQHDLIAVSTNHKILLKHAIAVDAPMAMNVDMATATALSPITETVNGILPGDVIGHHSIIQTANEIAEFDAGSGMSGGLIIPASLLAATDLQRFRITTETPTTGRLVSFSPPAAASATLLPELDNVAFTAPNSEIQASFGTLPQLDSLYLWASGTGIGGGSAAISVSQDLQVSGSYLTALGSTTLTIDTTAPGFHPEWNIETASNSPWYVTLDMSRRDGGPTGSVFVEASAWNTPVTPAVRRSSRTLHAAARQAQRPGRGPGCRCGRSSSR